jgi:hypothetical protein
MGAISAAAEVVAPRFAPSYMPPTGPGLLPGGAAQPIIPLGALQHRVRG